MSNKPFFLAIVASLCLLAVSVASPRRPVVTPDEPLTCPYCGGQFTLESFSLELGARMTLRSVRFLMGG